MDLTRWWLTCVCGVSAESVSKGSASVAKVEKEAEDKKKAKRGAITTESGNWKRVYWMRLTHLFSSQETLNNTIRKAFANNGFLKPADLHWFSDSTIISVLPTLNLAEAALKTAILSARSKITKIALAVFGLNPKAAHQLQPSAQSPQLTAGIPQPQRPAPPPRLIIPTDEEEAPAGVLLSTRSEKPVQADYVPPYRLSPDSSPERYFKNVTAQQFVKNIELLVIAEAPQEEYFSYLAKNFQEWHKGVVAIEFDSRCPPYAKLFIYDRPSSELLLSARTQLARNIANNVKNFSYPNAQKVFQKDIQKRIEAERAKKPQDAIKIHNYQELLDYIRLAIGPPPIPSLSPFPPGMMGPPKPRLPRQETASPPPRYTSPAVPKKHMPSPSSVEKPFSDAPPLKKVPSAASIQLQQGIIEKERAAAERLAPPEASRASLTKEILILPVNINDIERLYVTHLKRKEGGFRMERQVPPYLTRVELAFALADDATAELQAGGGESGLSKPVNPVELISKLHIREKIQLFEEMYGHAKCQRFADDIVKNIRGLLTGNVKEKEYGRTVLAYLYRHQENPNRNHFGKTLGEAYRSILMEFQSKPEEALDLTPIPSIEERRNHVKKAGEPLPELSELPEPSLIRDILLPAKGMAFIEDVQHVARRLNKLFYAGAREKRRVNEIVAALPLKAKLYLYETIGPGFKPVGLNERTQPFDELLLEDIISDCIDYPALKTEFTKYLEGVLADASLIKKYPDIQAKKYRLLLGQLSTGE